MLRTLRADVRAHDTRKIGQLVWFIKTELTCIEFDRRKRDTNYVRIMNMTTCAAMVGHNTGRNDVFLHEPNCMSVGIIMHEFLHIIGFQDR